MFQHPVLQAMYYKYVQGKLIGAHMLKHKRTKARGTALQEYQLGGTAIPASATWCPLFSLYHLCCTVFM